MTPCSAYRGAAEHNHHDQYDVFAQDFPLGFTLGWMPSTNVTMDIYLKFTGDIDLVGYLNQLDAGVGKVFS